MIGLGPVLGRIPWHEKLRRVLRRGRGARLGEATVVSRHIHMANPQAPQVVTILSYLDAGQVLYGRRDRGQIIHLDLFHELADVDHRRVAAAVRRALDGAVLPGDEASGRVLADYFDLCTGTGAGRVTGALNFGNASVRAAHRNHVHLAGRLPDGHLHLLVPLVGAVEAEVQAQGVQIRRVEKLSHAVRPGSAPDLDLSNYRDAFDSLNRGSGPRQGPGGSDAGTDGGCRDGQSLRGGRMAAGGGASSGSASAAASGAPETASGGPAGAGRGAGAAGAGAAGSGAAPPGADAGATGENRPVGGKPADGWEALEDERRLQEALALSRRLGSPDEVKRVLDDLSREQGWTSLYGARSSQVPYIIRQLEEDGLVRRDMRGLRLTAEGKALAAYLDRHLRDIKLRFRKLIRRMPSTVPGGQSRRPGRSRSAPSPDVRYGPVRGTAPAAEGSWLGEIAVPETVRAALTRSRLEALREGRPAGTGLRLQRQDVHVYLRSAEQPLHICLLIDASASMAGRRILAAKHLARHLLVSTRDRVAIIAFQERDVRVHVPFTRDWAQLEEGLSHIQPMGLTPLAHGLTRSLELIRESRVRRPLLLLITDGIPTVPKWSIDPLADALEAARQVGGARIPFGCIGLQPSRRFLEEMVATAGGTLHVVEELSEEVLVAIAHRERMRTAQAGR